MMRIRVCADAETMRNPKCKQRAIPDKCILLLTYTPQHPYIIIPAKEAGDMIGFDGAARFQVECLHRGKCERMSECKRR